MIVPTATYRLQFRNGIDFAAAADLAGYLQRLGISHLYASPIFAARSGSTHGYDTIDFNQLDSTLGGMAGFERMVEALQRHGLGLILDFVPNHMAASVENPWWRDTLEHGQASPHAGTFDIDWASGGGRVLLPVLGEPYGRVLERGELRIAVEAGAFNVRYHDHWFPVAPESHNLLAGDDPEAAAEAVSSDAGRLHQFLEAQHYRLCHWRLAPDALNYRRFFDINDLVAIRVDQPEVFDRVHELVLRLVGERLVDGLRLDHVDGLNDPAGYLVRLQERAAAASGGEPFYLLVEKILAPDETIRRDWPVAGTTGYEFANLVTGLQTDPEGLASLRHAYREFTGDHQDFAETAVASKRHVLNASFSGQLRALVDEAFELAQGDIASRDISTEALPRALTEVIVAFPAYRSYLTDRGAAAEDIEFIDAACSKAHRRLGAESVEALAFVCKLMKGDGPGALLFAARLQRLTGPVTAKSIEDTAFYRHVPLLSLNEVGGEPGGELPSIQRFHDDNRRRRESWPHNLLATATHDTKRGEDARARLGALSYDPQLFPEAARRWWSSHQPLRRRAGDRQAPHPKEAWLFYQSLIGVWPLDLAPGDREGVSALADRLAEFMRKAMREAKERTSWSDIDEDYEAAVLGFVASALDPRSATEFLSEVASLVEQIAAAGAVNSLSQLLFKLTAPGVPDIYQGTEFWDLSLVDPDNRRAVDFIRRAEALAEQASKPFGDCLSRWRDGDLKQFVIHTVLLLRRQHHALFSEGGYVPLRIDGPAADRVIAYARRRGEEAVIVCAPRDGRGAVAGLPLPDTSQLLGSHISLDGPLASYEWRDCFGESRRWAGIRVPLDELLSRLPVSLLYRSP